MSDLLLKAFEKEDNENLPRLRVGDNVTVHLRINVGDRNERVQLVRGVIIRLRNSGNNRNFTVRRIASNGIGVERTFLLKSPRIEKIEIHRHAHVRRAQLYFLRERTGKSARLREKRIY
jgi:large subunit ribosomal protein L19